MFTLSKIRFNQAKRCFVEMVIIFVRAAISTLIWAREMASTGAAASTA